MQVVLAAMLSACLALADEPARHELPTHKLSYQALAPKTGQAKPALVVYLHNPGPDDGWARIQKEYWPELAKRNCVLMHPAGKSRRMWLAGEDAWIMDAVADAGQRYSTNPARTILLGVAGGGQIALYMAERYPDKFACVIAQAANPVVARGDEAVWFYPPRNQAKKCSYFAANHITQGSAIQFWRQVQHAAAGYDVAVNVLPAAGDEKEYLGLPPPLLEHLDAVLAGKPPATLEDPQKTAVAKMLSPAVEELKKLLGKEFPSVKAIDGAPLSKPGTGLDLALTAPAGYERPAKTEADKDADGRPITQVKLEHAKWPIVMRAEARSTQQPWEKALAAEAAFTASRGMLYQEYFSADLDAGTHKWRVVVGSMTYPDQKRGWVSQFFLSAAAPHTADGRQWMRVLVMDETQQPDTKELACLLKTGLTTIRLSRGTKAAETQSDSRPASRN